MHKLAWMLLLLAVPGQAAEPMAKAGGRLVLYDGKTALTVAQAEEELGGERIALELRRGDQVVRAKLDLEGVFVVTAPPGEYRLEYLRIGERTEFIEPQQVHLEEGTLTCAGTLALQAGRLENLGTNQDNTVRVTDDCLSLRSKLEHLAGGSASPPSVTLARPAPVVEHPLEPDVADRLAQLRVEAGFGSVTAARATFIHELRLSWQPYIAFDLLADAGAVRTVITGSAGGVSWGTEVTGGAGFLLFGAHLVAYGGGRLYPTPIGLEPVAGLYLRLPAGPFGLGVRAELLPFTDWTAFIDVSPVALLGGLL